MSWSEVKKINSDLSTPLDKLIKGQRTWAGSDTSIVPLVNTRTTYTATEVTLGTITPTVNGTLRLKAKGFGGRRIYNNNTALMTLYIYVKSGSTTVATLSIGAISEQSVDFKITANTIYTISVKRESLNSGWSVDASAYLDNLYIGGILTDQNYISYTIS